MDAPQPEYPSEVRKDAFTFNDRGFMASGHARDNPTEIREVLFPRAAPRAARRLGATAKSRAKLKKTCVVAQLSHYGIDFKASASMADLQAKLGIAVKEGKCEVVPASIAALEAELSSSWQTKKQTYETEYEKWDIEENERFQIQQIEENKRKDAEFARLTSQFDEAKFSAERFVAEYFLDAQGRPDPQKTPNVIILENLSYDGWDDDMDYAVLQVAGLHTRTEGGGRRTVPEGTRSMPAGSRTVKLYPAKGPRYQRLTWIGWDKAAIDKAADAMEKWIEDDTKRAYWAPHEKLKKQAETKTVFGVGDLAGHYVVKCKTLEEGWDGGELFLDIHAGVRTSAGHDFSEASFDFRPVEGRMRLSRDEAFLDSVQSDDEPGGSDEDCEEDEVIEYRMLSRKRPTPPTATANPAKKTKINKPMKKKAEAAPISGKVYFKWRGRETGEGEIQTGDAEEFHGWLEFDPSLTTFTGSMTIPYTSDECVLKGFKMSMQPRKPYATPWEDLGEAGHEDEWSRRWH